MWFEAISRLNVNLNNKELIPVGSVENIDEIEQEFGWKVGTPSSS